MLDRKRCDEAPLTHDETTPGRAQGTFTLSRDYEDFGGPTRFLRPEGRARAPVIERDRMMMAMLVVGHRDRVILPTREIIAPPCAAGSRQTRPRVGNDISALARLNIDFAGASFDNVRRPQPCCSKVYSSTATVPTSIYKVVGGVMPPWE